MRRPQLTPKPNDGAQFDPMLIIINTMIDKKPIKKKEQLHHSSLVLFNLAGYLLLACIRERTQLVAER
jgi:hypothetical protein